MDVWSIAVAQLAGDPPPPVAWPTENMMVVRSPDAGALGRRAQLSRAATDQVLRQALQHGPLSIIALQAATGWPRCNLVSRLTRALDRGAVVRVRPGVYAAARACQHAAADLDCPTERVQANLATSTPPSER